MTEVVTDINRPDVNGTPALMTGLCGQVIDRVKHLAPMMNISCSDNFLSSIQIVGSLDPKESWSGGYYINSRYFRFSIVTEKCKKYYAEGDRVTVEMEQVSYKIPAHISKFRKYTGTPEKVIAKVEAWIKTTVAAEIG